MGNVVSRVEYIGSGSLATKYNYNASGSLIEEILPKGNGTKYAYDAFGNKTMIRKKTSMTGADNDTNDIVTLMTYTGVYNTPATLRDPLGNMTYFTSDNSGNIVSIKKTAITKGDGTTYDTIENLLYDTGGKLIQKTDAENRTMRYEYNAL